MSRGLLSFIEVEITGKFADVNASITLLPGHQRFGFTFHRVFDCNQVP
jgi:hypothetical protein